jgi:hypothetical protein
MDELPDGKSSWIARRFPQCLRLPALEFSSNASAPSPVWKLIRSMLWTDAFQQFSSTEALGLTVINIAGHWDCVYPAFAGIGVNM